MILFRHALRKAKAFKLTDWSSWQGRITIWVAAILAGLIVVLFAKASELANRFFFSIYNSYSLSPFIIMPLAGVAIVYVTVKLFPRASGSGIPQTIAALRVAANQDNVSPLVSLKIAFAKVMLCVAALASGFSVGREGPSVQVAASIMYSFRRFLPENFSVHPKNMILAGGAAGIAAAFNTPLAGVVFAVEELGRKFEYKTNGVLLSAIILSGLISISLSGNYTYFGKLTVYSVDASIFLPVLTCGLICGAAGGIFSRILLSQKLKSLNLMNHFRSLHPLWWAGICGLIVATSGWLTDGAVLGSGYGFTKDLLNGGAVESWYYPIAKYVATIFSYLSGIPGGIFAPSLSIGASIGSDLAPFFDNLLHGPAIIALCMAGFLAAVTQAPLTTFIIVMEMIDGHEMVLSLMAVTLFASIVSRAFSPPLYATLADDIHIHKPHQPKSV